MSRVHNFSAGPAALPLEVLDTIKSDIPDWNGTGMSVMEISHRSKPFIELAERCEANLRNLLAIPDNYSVLWIQGGATMQMAMAPLNLTRPTDVADYVDGLAECEAEAISRLFGLGMRRPQSVSEVSAELSISALELGRMRRRMLFTMGSPGGFDALPHFRINEDEDRPPTGGTGIT